MHAVITTVGTGGDVYPFVGLGKVLRSRGHRATLLGPATYGDRVREHGLEFGELVTQEEDAEVLSSPDFWHPLKAGPKAARWGARLIERQYEHIAEVARGDDSVLISSVGLLPARIVSEKLSRPLVTVILQPWLIPSIDAPPRMAGGMTLPGWAPRPFGRLDYRSLDGVTLALVGKQLHALRRSLGLPRVRRVFRWWFSPHRVLGLFPRWYASPQPDWPEQLVLTGFPLFDASSGVHLGEDVAAFCDAGTPPVLFTFGTGMLHARMLFEVAIEATVRGRRRAILLTRHAEQLPDVLPPHVLHVPFAPFRELFPRCAAVVHHGGIGTTAEALAAGVPQLIAHFSWDQPDNAWRVARLGAGFGLGRRRRTAGGLAAALSELLGESCATRCRELAGRLQRGVALERAADEVEALAASASDVVREA